MPNFYWQKLPKPFICLAPLAGISDSPFRQICKEFGADVVFTEMISAEGLSREQNKTLELTYFSQKERPIILQLFGKNSESFGRAAQVIQNLPHGKKPDGIDLNLGCPARKVKTHGSGIALMRDPDLVNKIIAAITANTDLPLSIKIRAGIIKEGIKAASFISKINWRKLAAITVHGRYLEQGFSGPIDYAEIKKIKMIVGDKTVIGNGGIKNLRSAQIMFKKTDVDGVMIGKGALGRPWVFEKIKRNFKRKTPQCLTEVKGGRNTLPLDEDGEKEGVFAFSLPNTIKTALKHARLMIKLKGEEKGIREMRKHLLWYFHNFEGAKGTRKKLTKIETFRDLEDTLLYLSSN